MNSTLQEDNDSLRKETTTLRKEKQELVEALAKCSAADEQLLLALADAENLRKENGTLLYMYADICK